MDLFEFVQQKLCCEYISDLGQYPCIFAARREMAQMDLQPYSLGELEDMAEYLYFKRPCFRTARQAEEFFRLEISNV